MNKVTRSKTNHLLAPILACLIASHPQPLYAADLLDPPGDIHQALQSAQPQVQFTRAPAPAAGEQFVPEGPLLENYTLGSGDTFNLHIWNQRLNLAYTLTVNPEGAVFVPQLGRFQVAGLSPAALRQAIQRAARRIQDDTVQVAVLLQRVRAIKVLVTGFVKTPGHYTVQWGSRLIDVLRLAGGVNDNGSVRRLELRQLGQKERVLDLYRFHYQGDLTANPRLEAGAQLHVPPMGSHVALLGQVRNPGIYEILEGEILEDILQLAGGLTPAADPQAVRVWPQGMKRGQEEFIGLALQDPYPLMPGDVVYLPAHRLPEEAHAVYAYGQVLRPGALVYRRGMTVSQALQSAGGPTDKGDLEKVQLSREQPDGKRTLLTVNLQAVLFEGKPEQDLALQAGDILFVPEKFFNLRNVTEVTTLVLTGLGIISVIINLSRGGQ